MVDQRDRRHGAVGAEGDRAVVLSRLQRESVEHSQVRIEEVPGSGRRATHGDKAVHAGRRALREQRGLAGRAGQDLYLSRTLREVEHVDLVVGAAADGHCEVMGVGDQADRTLALEVRPRRQRLDRALERIDPEQPVVGDDAWARATLGWPVVVDCEVDHRVRDVGRRSPHGAGHAKRPRLRQRRHQRGLAGAGVYDSDPLARHVGNEPVAERAGDRRWAVLRSARGAAARGEHERSHQNQQMGAMQPRHELRNSNVSYPAGVSFVAVT